MLSSLSSCAQSGICAAVAPFLDDANETVRYYAVAAIFGQSNADTVRDQLRAAFLREESVRARARILEGYVNRSWKFDAPLDTVQANTPTGFTVTSTGVVVQKA